MALQMSSQIHLNATNHALVQIITHLMSINQKKYCFPSQRKLCLLLAKYHNIHIHRRALNYALYRLEKMGYIRRKRRITAGLNNQPIFQSTLYYIGFLGEKYLNRIINNAVKLKDILTRKTHARSKNNNPNAKKIEKLRGKRLWKTPEEERAEVWKKYS